MQKEYAKEVEYAQYDQYVTICKTQFWYETIWTPPCKIWPIRLDMLQYVIYELYAEYAEYVEYAQYDQYVTICYNM